MKDLSPPPAVLSPTGSEVMAAGGTKNTAKTHLEALFGGSPTGSSDGKASFVDAFERVLRGLGTQNGSPASAARGGKPLPLALPAAESGPMTAMPASTALQRQEGVALAAGLLSESDIAAADGADLVSQPVLLPDVSRLPQPNSPGVDRMPGQAGRAGIAETTLNSIAARTPGKADGLTLSAESQAVMLPDSLEAQQSPDVRKRAMAVNADLVSHHGKAAMADAQLQSAIAMTETDQLFTSRMQLAAVNQMTDAAGQKLALEPMLNTTQPASSETILGSLARSPIQPTAVSSDSLATASAQSSVTEAFGKPEWAQGMGKQVLWMVNQSISRAEIRLNPANLGPLEVCIDMENDKVNVVFTSRHAEVREAVEQALPRLREMLEDKGLNLSEANVSQHSFAEQHGRAFGQADDHSSGLASSSSLIPGRDQQRDDGPEAFMHNNLNNVHYKGLVDYYI